MVDRITPRTQPLPRPQTGPVPEAIAPKAPTARPRLQKDTAEFALSGSLPEKPTEPPKGIGGTAKKLWRLAHELVADPLHGDLTWKKGQPLSEGVNAHSTNTAEDMKAALESDHGYNWLEGDVRFEIDHKDRIEMRHDETHEQGDNLTLREWLEVGKASGKGLKLDFKEGKAIPEALRMIKEIGIPEHRIMINVGDGDTEKYGALIRKELPGAIIALNPADALDGHENADGPYEDWQLDRLIAQAERLGQPTAFVLREDRVTPEIVKKLEAVGPVSIWNAPSRGGVDDVEARRKELESWGVTGVIDLRESYDTLDKIREGLGWLESQALHYTDAAKDKAEDAVEEVVDTGKDLVEGGVDLAKKGWNAIF